MTAQPAIQTCRDCRMVQTILCHDFSRGPSHSHRVDCWIVEPCRLHRGAAATARERDNLAAALEDARNLIKDYQAALSDHLGRTEAIHAAAKGGAR